ncbi:hypothetical protein F442_01682 [Phytophthora nicotianae P10297]|uniref:Uncharacterized protein n=2 Tax=Phytophthora nicotianae TaxID=4792 RepID=V9FVR2_PHYNI|nr:hypothetical protein F443_01738 [Phytophthora nicotianae P1569]ETP53413.1 hypothetical protein F442_01682 [Phytophthora nicotianae P10297]
MEWRSTRWGSLAYDLSSQYFLFPPVRMTLYCMPTFHRQFEFLRGEVLSEGHLGWILGPPGTGKSTTAMAFVPTLNRREWIVTSCVGDACRPWEIPRGHGDSYSCKGFHVWSLILDEYLNAIKNDDVFQSVSQCLDSPAVLPDEEMSRAAMVESKYYYTGGSCRYMFYFRTATVATKLSGAVNSLNDATSVATSGQRSSSSINRLFGCPSDLMACGPDAIKKVMSTHQDNPNPALDGWKLEMEFFASLRNGGLALQETRLTRGVNQLLWLRMEYLRFLLLTPFGSSP